MNSIKKTKAIIHCFSQIRNCDRKKNGAAGLKLIKVHSCSSVAELDVS